MDPKTKIELVWQEVLARLTDKINLTENQGEVSFDMLGLKIHLVNFAIKKLHFIYFIPYMRFRSKIHETTGILMSEESEHTEEERIKANIEFTDVAFKLITLATNMKKTDFAIFTKKFVQFSKSANNDQQEKNDDSQIVKMIEMVLNYISAIDYAFWRGQQLMEIMNTAIESGDVNKIKELNEKKILPYSILVAESKEEMEKEIEKRKQDHQKLVEEKPLYDLSSMQVIGEA